MSSHMYELSRRGVASLTAALAAGILVNVGGIWRSAGAAAEGLTTGKRSQVDGASGTEKKSEGNTQGGEDEDVSATEDLMREHGILRRVLIIYAEVGQSLRSGSTDINPAALSDAAKLFREFGENYHERTLEEQYVFPELRRAGGANEKLVEVLLVQHQRGREITDFVLRMGERGLIGNDASQIATALTSMARMYQAHAAWEDTVIFPAWKKLQSKGRLEELAEKFEEIEHQKFGADGFDDALARVERLERSFSVGDLAIYTAPPVSSR